MVAVPEGPGAIDIVSAVPEGQATEQVVEGALPVGQVPPNPEQARESEVARIPYGGMKAITDTSIPEEDRLEAYRALDGILRARVSAWAADGRPSCTQCKKDHPPPCLNEEEMVELKSARKAGSKLAKTEANKAKAKAKATEPEPPVDTTESGDVYIQEAGPEVATPKVKVEPEDETSKVKAEPEAATPKAKKAKKTPCTKCAGWHKGGAEACRAPLCATCGIHHFRRVACSEAKTRFDKAFGVAGGQRSGRNAPTKALDHEDLAKFSTLFNNMGNDPTAMKAFGQLLTQAATTGKRKAEDEQEAGSKRAKTTKKVSKPGNDTPAPKPHKPDDDGKGGALPLR
jgi:hypothetical protein